MKFCSIRVFLFIATFGVAQVDGCGNQVPDLKGFLSHPEFPESYSANADCRWNTIARPKDDVTLVFEVLDLETDNNGACTYDYVSISFEASDRPQRFCGRPASRAEGEVKGTQGKGDPTIRFITDDSMQFAGFNIAYEITRYDYCLDEPCQNDGVCVLEDSTEDGWVCECREGWEGRICDEDKDECAEEPCQNGGTCETPEFNMYNCICAPGYTGENCETDINECESTPCENGGECVDEVNSYTCQCRDGYQGIHCEEDINECDSNPCKNGGSCLNQIAAYVCRCTPGYEGDDCGLNINECASEPCQNDGRCEDRIDEYYCNCEAGFVGKECQIDIPECRSDPCLNGARCFEPEPNMYFCACSPGYSGTTCEIDIDECHSNPCMNSATCVDRVNDYSCECSIGYSGTDCEIEVNECDSTPCENNGTCRDKVGSFQCSCVEGFTGIFCEIEISHCDSNPCENGATCNSTRTAYSCLCPEGFEGERCETDVDECASEPCLNGGSCIDDVNRFDCECFEGYGGTFCEIELDECDSAPCKNGGNCIDYPSKFECICKGGFGGTTCEDTQDDPCVSVPCQNGGECKTDDKEEGFRCVCKENFQGKLCEENDANATEWKNDKHCHPYSCLNNGACEQGEDYFTCSCKPGFTGKYCETDVNECESNPCSNGGSCMDRENEFWCICRDGFTGLQCEDIRHINEPSWCLGFFGDRCQSSDSDWQKDSYLLSALLPSILFLIIIGILAALFLLWVRKKRANINKVTSIDVKPAKAKNKEEKGDKYNKISEKRRKNPKKHSENPVRDFSGEPLYDPRFSIVELQQNFNKNPNHPTSFKFADPTLIPNPAQNSIQYSTVPGVGMVYPTDHPQNNIRYPQQQQYHPHFDENPYEIPMHHNDPNRYNDFQKYHVPYDADRRYYKPPDPVLPRNQNRTKPAYKQDGDDYERPTKKHTNKERKHPEHRKPVYKDHSNPRREERHRSRDSDDVSEIELDEYGDPPAHHYNPKQADDNASSIDSELPFLHGRSVSEIERNNIDEKKSKEPPDLLERMEGKTFLHDNPKRNRVRFAEPKVKADHWQDRDTERLHNVPEKHQRSYTEMKLQPKEREPKRTQHNTGRQLYRKRSVTFCEPEETIPDRRQHGRDRAHENRHDSTRRPMEREKTGFFPNKTKLHRRSSNEDRNRTDGHQNRSNLRRRHSSDRDRATPVKDNTRNRDKERYARRPPEGDSSALSGESANNHPKRNEKTPASYSSPFKLIRRNNSLRVNEGRGFRREGAFFQQS